MDDDLHLMQRLRDDDESALAEIVDDWQGPVLGYVCRFLGCDDDEARDVAQEVFLRVWRNRRRYDARGRFAGWLFTIVANVCRNRVRDRGRRPRMVPLDAVGSGDQAVSSPFGPQEVAEAKAVARRLRQALAALPETQRAALLLRRFLGLSYRDIGAVLEISPGAVDGLLTRARTTLAKKLSDGPQETAPSGVHGGDGND